MSNLVNDVIIENIADDVCELYSDKGVWGVIDAIAEEFGNDKVPYSKDDDEQIDALIELRFEALCQWAWQWPALFSRIYTWQILNNKNLT